MPPITRLMIREYGDLSPRGQMARDPADARLDNVGNELQQLGEDAATSAQPYSTESIGAPSVAGGGLDILA